MVIPSNLTRLKGGNITSFALALKEEKCNTPPEALKQQAGQKRNGKPGLDGRYAKWDKTQFDNPEKNAYYYEKAKKMNEKGEEGGDSSCDRQPVGILDLKSHQARGLRDLEKLVSPRPGIQVILNMLWLMHWHSLQVVDLASRDIHIICLVTPSENVKPLTFCRGGPAESITQVITGSRRVLFEDTTEVAMMLSVSSWLAQFVYAVWRAPERAMRPTSQCWGETDGQDYGQDAVHRGL